MKKILHCTTNWKMNVCIMVNGSTMSKIGVAQVCKNFFKHFPNPNIFQQYSSTKNLDKKSIQTECSKRLHPPNGKIRCESATNSLGSSCYLTCNPGYMPIQKTMTTCLYHNASKQFMWDVEGGFLCEIRFQIILHLL